ncbi:glycosyltransferase family 4 protein [Streptomyces goshikiensis]|uniref:glycosyltransferase family 4 protein n=1 Tax=Streptomyces goshikiensis TaxID=1942 RepID=UPI0036768F87
MNASAPLTRAPRDLGCTPATDPVGGHVVVLVHEGMYGAVSGSGFSNRTFLIALAGIVPHGRLVVVPVLLPADHPGYDPGWAADMEGILQRADARVLPIHGASLLTGPVDREALCYMAVRRAVPYLGTGSLVVGCDVPFLAVGSYAPEGTAVLLVPRSTALLSGSTSRETVEWERRGLAGAVHRGGRIAAISDHMREHLCEEFGLPDVAVVDMPNGLLTGEEFSGHRKAPPLPPAARAGFILAMGRAEASKGFEDLLHAVRLLADAAVAVPHLVLVAGSSAGVLNACQRRLKILVGSLGVDATLLTRFDPAVRGWLRDPSLHAVVVPSREEPFGRIPLEAFAAGAGPVVATTAGGLAQTVRDGETGYSASPHAPQELAVALRRALEAAPGERRRLARAGARLVARHHDYAVTIRTVVSQCAPWTLTTGDGGPR